MSADSITALRIGRGITSNLREGQMYRALGAAAFRQLEKVRAPLRSAGADHRKPLLLGATRCILALRRCKARLDRVLEIECHGIGL